MKENPMSKNDFETNTAVELIKVYFSVDANSDPRIRLEGPYNSWNPR